MELSFCIPGDPIPKQRSRIGRRGHAYTPARTRSFEDRVGWAARAAGVREPLEGPLVLRADVSPAHPATLRPGQPGQEPPGWTERRSLRRRFPGHGPGGVEAGGPGGTPNGDQAIHAGIG